MPSNPQLVAERRRTLKRLVVEYMGGKCFRCGWNEHQSGLVPHHVASTQKEFSLSRNGHTVKWERLRQECDKCILLCANCHAVIHATNDAFYFNAANIPKYVPVFDTAEARRRFQNECADCSASIGYYSTYCKPCAGRRNGLKARRIEWPDIDWLVQRVEEIGYKKCGKELGISDNAIRKHIKVYSQVADVGLSG